MFGSRAQKEDKENVRKATSEQDAIPSTAKKQNQKPPTALLPKSKRFVEVRSKIDSGLPKWNGKSSKLNRNSLKAPAIAKKSINKNNDAVHSKRQISATVTSADVHDRDQDVVQICGLFSWMLNTQKQCFPIWRKPRPSKFCISWSRSNTNHLPCIFSISRNHK